MYGLVQHELDPAALSAKPCGSIQIPVGQALLDGFDAVLFHLGQHGNGLAVIVSLIGIHSQADIRADGFTDQRYGPQILFRTDPGLNLQDVVA